MEETLPRINYWGFKKGYYFAPKASYSVKDPVLEFKEMVRAFHAEGMEVILQFYFPKEINREMILEVIRYWVCEYHIDGVHLMGEQIPVGILASDPMLTDTKLTRIQVNIVVNHDQFCFRIDLEIIDHIPDGTAA